MRTIINNIHKNSHGQGEDPARPERRRALRLIAASAAALLGARPAAAAVPVAVHWQGRLLGAPAELTLYPQSAAAGHAALAAVTDEIGRLEGIFSLARADSALRRLNETGTLDDPPGDLCELLVVCRELHAASAGVFDPSMQALWRLYSTHFADIASRPDGPDAEAIAEALSRVGLRHVTLSDHQIRLERQGLALSLNGIAQGFVTERARDILAKHGLPHALVNLGEFAALGPRPAGGPWRLAVAHPEIPWRTLARVSLANGEAIATSAPAGTVFDTAQRFHHLIDPRSGRCSATWRSVSVCGPSATLADGLSTALAVASPELGRRLLAHYPEYSALVLGHDDHLDTLGTDFPLEARTGDETVRG